MYAAGFEKDISIHGVNTEAVQSFKYLEAIVSDYSALLWQKEASDIPSKFELLMFS